MLYVALYVEALRTRPRLVFWLATLTQALIWLVVPLAFYAAPPGDLPEVLAIGRHFPLTGNFGPPLAFWLAEIAFRAGGLFGVYLLSQLCVVVTYWCVFALGSALVGATFAAMAVLLMTGISVFTVPTPDFGPPLLTTALWAVALLHYWRAAMQKRRLSWYAFGAAAALILLTSSAALVFLGLVAAFAGLTARGRAALAASDAWIVGGVLAVFLGLHLYLLVGSGDGLVAAFSRLREAGMAAANTRDWLRLLGGLVLAHAGLAILVVLASGWPRFPLPAASIARAPLDPLAQSYVKTFALAPGLLATIAAVLFGQRLPIGGFTPLLVLSGLAAVVAAGERITLHHERILGAAWTGLLLLPTVFVPVVMVLLPWTTATELRIAQPAAAMGRFFAQSFERRTGRPLAIVGGEAATAALVALAAPGQPSVYFAADPARSPWITMADIRNKGAILVWPASGFDPQPPAAIKARFPDLVAEVPETFARPVRGRLPPLRIGWGMIRPASVPPTSAPH